MDINKQVAKAEAALRSILDEHNSLPETARDQLAACRQQYGEKQAEYLRLLAQRNGS